MHENVCDRIIAIGATISHVELLRGFLEDANFYEAGDDFPGLEDQSAEDMFTAVAQWIDDGANDESSPGQTKSPVNSVTHPWSPCFVDSISLNDVCHSTPNMSSMFFLL